jgi:hypothetical protein
MHCIKLYNRLAKMWSTQSVYCTRVGDDDLTSLRPFGRVAQRVYMCKCLAGAHYTSTLLS